MENDTQIKCIICNLESVRHFTVKNGHNLYKCDKCGLLSVHPIPDPSSIYTDSYFEGAKDGHGYINYDADKEPMRITFHEYLDEIKKEGKIGGKLLDVGAATGFFMQIAKERGFDVEGIEVSDFAAEKGRSKGLDIKTGDLESASLNEKYFDVITMFDVVEHIPNPELFFNEAKRILSPGGLLVINTPDASSLCAKTFGSKWHLLVPPEHIHYFSPYNLGDYLTNKGFEVRSSKKIGKRFTFQYIFNTLHSWQGFGIWKKLSNFFSKEKLSNMYIPINLRDNFFMILKKTDEE